MPSDAHLGHRGERRPAAVWCAVLGGQDDDQEAVQELSMNLYFTLASYAAAAASGFAVAWQLQAGTISDIHLEAAHELMQQQADARDEAERRIAQVTAAQDRAAVRVRAISTERSSADAVGNGLRLTTAETVRTAAENPAACADHAATLGIVFDQCSARLIEVATDADRWASQAIEQHEAAR